MSKKQGTYLVDIMADTLGLTFDGIDFGDRFSREAMQNRMFGIMHSKENNWAQQMYEAFLREKALNSNMSAHDFLDVIKSSYAKKGVDIDSQLYGIIDFETMGNVFDTFEGMENSLVIASFLSSASTKQVSADADLAYFYMDQVAQMISADDTLRENYATMDIGGRQTMIRACLKSLKAKGALQNPSPKQLKLAQNRWRSYYRRNSDEAMMVALRDDGVDISKQGSFVNRFANSIAEVIQKDERRYLIDRGDLRRAGEAMVDVVVNPDSRLTNMNHSINSNTTNVKDDDSLIEFGKLYPRGIPQHQIAKMLQPYNIKAGLKFLDQIIDAFQHVMVQNPWPEHTKA